MKPYYEYFYIHMRQKIVENANYQIAIQQTEILVTSLNIHFVNMGEMSICAEEIDFPT